MMKSVINIGFFGSCKVELIHYLSRILVVANKKIAIIDASYEQVLKYTIPENIGLNGLVNYRGVDIYTEVQDKQKMDSINTSNYDYVLIDYGTTKNYIEDLQECSKCFLVTNFERENIVKTKQFLSALDIKIKIIKIYKDLVRSKIDDRYIDFRLEINDRVQVLDSYNIFLNEDDYRNKISVQYDDVFKFNKISKELRELIYNIANQYLEIEKNMLKKVMKKAERGN